MYKSVLYDNSLDEGVKERRIITQARDDQVKEREEFEEAYRQKVEEIKANTAEDDLEAALEQAEEEFNTKQEEFKEPEEKDYEFEWKKFLICIDTMGEDVGIDQADRKYIEELSNYFVS